MSAATTTHISPMPARTPRTAQKPAPSPNYFNPLVSPQSSHADSQANLDAFRRQSESNTFTLGPSNLSYFSTSSGAQNVSTENSPAGSRRSEDNVLSPYSQPNPNGLPVDKETQTTSMDISTPSPRLTSPSAKNPRTKSPGANTSSFFDLPRHHSPHVASPAELPRKHVSHVDERHSSLPHNKAEPPSPAPREPVQRAETLPSSISTDSPNLISPQELSEIIETYSPSEVLLLDVRVFPQYSQSRIEGALNLCIPTTLLKRPAFNVQKLAETFNREKERARFAQWREAKVIVVYDASSFLLKDATSSVNTLKKFANEGWHGSPCIIRGGYLGFSKKFPSSIDRRPASEMESSQGRKLSIDTNKPIGAPVAGGCAMPTNKSTVNPFFGTIRQNMDLIDGVGQIPIPLPSSLKNDPWSLPPWLKRATSPRDMGKVVADYFLEIEKGEQRRMQKALNSTVHYGSPSTISPNAIRIAGIEKGTKNRYKDMLPFDHSRVRLQNVPIGECDYINASHIKSALSGRHYIASQAPVPATIEDFWRLVWEQNVYVIVMLTAEHDGGQRKSHPYWDGSYGKYSVVVDETRSKSLDTTSTPSASADAPHVTIRQITVTGPGASRRISQLQYSSWPDFGVPTDPKHLLNLVRASCGEVMKYEDSAKKDAKDMPVLVHCSAGCGRTGTFCTVDSVVATMKTRLNDWENELFGPQSEAADDLIAKTVEDFRLQRLSMVQTLRQFVLCYETVLKWYSEWLAENIEEVRAHKRSVDEMEASGATNTPKFEESNDASTGASNGIDGDSDHKRLQVEGRKVSGGKTPSR